MEPILINRKFGSFEGFASTARAWDVDFLQIEKVRFQARLIQLICDDLQFAQACFSCGLDQRGAAPKGVWTFAITFSPEMQMYFKGRAIDGSSCLMIYPPGSEINAISKCQFGVLTFSAPEHFLESLADINGYSEFRRQSKDTDVLVCQQRDIQAIRFLLIRLLSGVANSRIQSDDLGRFKDISGSVPVVILKAIYHHDMAVPQPIARLRDHAFNQAMSFIRAHARENVSVKSLIGHIGVSERTLQYVFRERFGISPKRYIQIHRLNRVRKSLLKADYSVGEVTNTVNRWGFWHIGQFAKDYKKEFGELPSETIKNKAIPNF